MLLCGTLVRKHLYVGGRPRGYTCGLSIINLLQPCEEECVMKNKLIGFGVALLAVATVGIVQLTSEALEPGTVGSAPRCTVKSVGPRGEAYKISGNTATVKFKVSGSDNCKVKLSSNAFYAPSMNGRPYDKQTLYDRTTNTYSKPGTYSMAVKLPAKSTPAKGCFYQVDLTYGLRNVLPVLAYGHGKLDCSVPKPVAKCESLVAKVLTDNRVQLNAKAFTKDGAKIKGYIFTVTKAGNAVYSKTVASTAKAVSVTTPVMAAGTYSTKVVVKTSEGNKGGKQCTDTFTIAKKPSAICKLLVSKKLSRTSFQFNATAEAKNGASIKSYTFTVRKGATVVATLPTVTTSNSSASTTYEQTGAGTYTVTVEVLTSLGKKTSPACVATFTVEPNMVPVCDPETGEVITVNEEDADNYVPVGSPECEDAEVCVLETKTIETIKVSDFDAELHSYDLSDCEEPEMVPVCDPATGEIITVKEEDADNYVPVNSPECEDVTVCVLETGETDTIKKSDFDADIHSYTLSDCDEPEEPPVEELPKTGAAEVAMQLMGASSIAGAGSYYVASRRRA